jgi:hypothetical protein
MAKRFSKSLVPYEADEQRTYFEWVEIQKQRDWRYSNIFHVPNGAHLAKGAQSYRFLKSIGTQKGVPDVCIAIPSGESHGLFIEFKRAGSPLRAEQQIWIRNLRSAGYLAFACRTAQMAMDLTNTWMARSSLPSILPKPVLSPSDILPKKRKG